jgi:hypothetical protein
MLLQIEDSPPPPGLKVFCTEGAQFPSATPQSVSCFVKHLHIQQTITDMVLVIIDIHLIIHRRL